MSHLAVPDEPGWVNGYLHIENRPVAAVLGYDPEDLTGLEVSGVLPLDDTERALRSLASALPLEVNR